MKHAPMNAAMTNAETTPGDRRKTARHAGSWKVAWRALGNRHLHFGEASVKDIGTDGLALNVDHFCPKGAVVIVQFEKLGPAFAEPLLLQAQWCREVPLRGSGNSAYLVGCSFAAPLANKDLYPLLASTNGAEATLAFRKDMPAKLPPVPYPPSAASTGDKRAVMRRGGFAVRVTLSCADEGRNIDGSVVDRSLKGLGIIVSRPFAPGTSLTVQPTDIRARDSSVPLEVRTCRQKGNKWHLGCRFLQAPPPQVTKLLG